MSTHTLSVLVENSPGVLARVSSLLKIVALEPSAAVERELMLIKVKTDQQTRGQVLETVQLFRAKVVDVAQDSVTIEATGDAGKLAAMLNVLEPFGIREIAQSGRVAIGRGSRSITDRTLRAVPGAQSAV